MHKSGQQAAVMPCCILAARISIKQITNTSLTSLSSRQRAFLRSLAHPLKPVAFIGKEGVTDAAVQSLTDAFNTRELLKVKVQQMAPEESHEVAAMLTERIDELHVVQIIGRTVVLYRPFSEHPKIRLPRRGQDRTSDEESD
jgi:RNA-binding protein